METLGTVYFEETGEERKVVGRCRNCERTHFYVFSPGYVSGGVVSPSGVWHLGADYGLTACGKDATHDGWWWPS